MKLVRWEPLHRVNPYHPQNQTISFSKSSSSNKFVPLLNYVLPEDNKCCQNDNKLAPKKPPRYISVIQGDFQKYKQDVREGSVPDIIKRIEDPSDPYPFDSQGNYSPEKEHVITGRVPGKIAYFLDLCKYGVCC